jgi:hypothetical protein
VPASLTIIDLLDIVGLIKDTAIDKIMNWMLQNAIDIKQKPFSIIVSYYYRVLQKRTWCCRM